MLYITKNVKKKRDLDKTKLQVEELHNKKRELFFIEAASLWPTVAAKQTIFGRDRGIEVV